MAAQSRAHPSPFFSVMKLQSSSLVASAFRPNICEAFADVHVTENDVAGLQSESGKYLV